MLSDLRFAFRQLLKTPGFTGVAVLTLALGIGLNTSMFSLMNLFFLQPLPYPERDQLVRIYRTTPQTKDSNHSAFEFQHVVEGTRDTASVAAFRMWGYNLTPADRPPVNLSGLRVSGDFFTVVGMQPEVGRLFTADEDRAGNQVAIISHATWHAQFGGDPAVVGRTVRIDGESITIVGVMPSSFSSVFLWGPGDIFRPLALSDAERANLDEHELSLIGRRHAGESLDQFNTRLATLATRLAPLRGEANRNDSLTAVSLQSLVQNRNTLVLTVFLLGLSGAVLLIACANLANLLLARAIARAHEYAVRAALGASRARLLRPLLSESLLLAVGGGLFGVLVATWANDWISSRLSENGFVKFTLVLNWEVFAFAVVVTLLTGLVFGIVPAWLMSRINVNDTLKSGGRSSTGDRAHNYFRDSLIAGQFALALILLAGAGFFILGVNRMMDKDTGWDTHQISMAVVNLPPGKYPGTEKPYLFFTQLQERLATLPGAEHVTVAWTLPLFQYLTNRNVVVEGREPPPAGHEPLAGVNGVTPGYLDTLGVKLVAGRNFTHADTPTAPQVAIINETMARSLFPNESPIGKRLGSLDPANRNWVEIVGVVEDSTFAVSFNAPPTRSLILRPLAQETWNYVTIAVRSSSPESLLVPMRKIIAEMDSDLPLQQFGTVRQVAAQFATMPTMMSTVLMAFACLGLLLAALGLYGVVARIVVQRTPEIGLRVALGAQSRDVLRLVLGSGIRLSAIGAGVGLLGAYGLSAALAAIAPDMAASDTAAVDSAKVMGGVLLLLLIIALIACWLPARRATKVDPMVALRAE